MGTLIKSYYLFIKKTTTTTTTTTTLVIFIITTKTDKTMRAIFLAFFLLFLSKNAGLKLVFFCCRYYAVDHTQAARPAREVLAAAGTTDRVGSSRRGVYYEAYWYLQVRSIVYDRTTPHVGPYNYTIVVARVDNEFYYPPLTSRYQIVLYLTSYSYNTANKVEIQQE